jgi:hypothetical protein
MVIAGESAWRVDPRLTHWHVSAQVQPPAGAVRSRPFVSDGPFCHGSFALGRGHSPTRKPHGPCTWKRLAGRPTADSRLVQAQVHRAGSAVRSRPIVSAGPLRRGSFAPGTGEGPMRKPNGHCTWKRLAGRPTADSRLVQAQVHRAGSAVRSRPFVSAGPLRRGSFAPGTGEGPMRKPNGHCTWKRLAGRPTADPPLVQAQVRVHSPASRQARRPRPGRPLGAGVVGPCACDANAGARRGPAAQKLSPSKCICRSRY